MMKRTHTVLLILNLLWALAGIGILSFTALFWMGTKQAHDDLVKNSYRTFLASRFVFNLLAELLILTLVGGMNWLVQKMVNHWERKQIWAILAIDFFVFTIFSIVFIASHLS